MHPPIAERTVREVGVGRRPKGDRSMRLPPPPTQHRAPPPLPIPCAARHLASAFGDDWFGVKAEAFARFFARPRSSSARAQWWRSGSRSTSSASRASTSTFHPAEPRVQPAGRVRGAAHPARPGPSAIATGAHDATPSTARPSRTRASNARSSRRSNRGSSSSSSSRTRAHAAHAGVSRHIEQLTDDIHRKVVAA